jgi:hypothetical protein
MPVVGMPDGTQVEFPDDMPGEQIRSLIAQKFPNEAKALAPQSPISAGGLFNALDSGVAKGVALLGSIPRTVSDLGATGIGKATNFVERQLGMPESPGPPGPGRFPLPSYDDLQKHIQQKYYGGAAPYEPQNTTEEYVKTVGEFVPGAVMGPGGLIAKGAQAVIPGVASEAAGQFTKGSDVEPYARAGAAVLGSGATSLLSRPGTAANAIREQLPPGVTPQMVDNAQALMQDAAQRGIRLTWPEALSQVAQRPVLTNAMRHLEASPQTEARMAEVFAGRPQAIEQAARREAGNIAPVNPAPSTIGPAVGTAAEDTINGVRQNINAVAEPYYTASATIRLTPQEMNRVRALPGFPEARDAVRNDPQLNRYVQGLPDDSVGFLNEVKKYLDQSATNARAPVNAQQNMQRAAGYGNDATFVRDAAGNAYFGNPARNYETALAIERQGRQQFLEPLLQGPLGKIAAKDTTTKNAINALFPQNPLPNSAQEITTAVGALAARNARAARDLVRAHIESTFNTAAKDLQSGAAQMGGANFRKQLVGNAQQAENLEAAVRALPNGGQVWPGFNRFLEVLEATGTRQNIGSRTAYNAELLKGQSTSGLAVEAAKGAASPIRGAQFLSDKYERFRLGRNLNELADILTNPGSANQLRAIARMPVGSGQAEAAVIRLLTAAQSSRTP